MEEVGFPGQHTTTTTVTSRTTVEPNLRFDPLYVQTVPGLLKVVQVLLSLLGFISVQCAGYENHKAFFSFVAMVAFWFTGILLGLYLFHLVEKFYKVPWLRIEFGFCAAWTFFYLLAASLVVSVSYASSAYSAAAFFGYACMLAYAADAFLKYRAARSGGLAQGTRVVSKQVTSQVTSPEREGY